MATRRPTTVPTQPAPIQLVRRAVLLALPACALLAAGGLFFYAFHAPRVRAASDQRWLADLTFRAEMRQAGIESGLRELLADARVASSFPSTQELCSDPRDAGADGDARHLGEILAIVAAQEGISWTALLDARGRVLAASRADGDPDLAQGVAGHAIETGSGVIGIHLDPSGKRAHVLAAAPVACSGAAASRRRAAVVVETSADAWLFPLLATQPVPGMSTLESLLVRPAGDRLVYLSPLRFRHAPGIGYTIPAAGNLAALRSLSGSPSAAEFVDYRGVPVFAAVRPIRGTDWGLVVKVDRAEARRPVEDRLVMEATIGGLGLLSAGFTASAVLFARRRALAARLAGERARFAAALDEANDAIFFLDAEGRIVDANRRAEMIYGRPRAELLGLEITELRPPAERSAARSVLETLREKGHLIFEAVHQRADGTTFPAEISSRWIDAPGGPSILGIVRDISAARLAEESFRRLFENNPYPTWVFDLETLRFLAVNGAAVALYGWSREEFLGMTLVDIRPAEDVPALEEEVAQIRAGGPARVSQRRRHCRRDGSLLEVEIHAYEHRWEGRRARVVVVEDVTARDRAERELRKLTRAVEQSPASVVITDLDGNIEYVNPTFCEVTGYRAEEVLGKNPRILKSGVTPAEIYREMWAALAAGRVWQGELCNRKKDGTLFWEEVSISPLVEADGTVTNYVAVKEDVSAQRQLAAELEQAQRLESIGRLAGGVAHDINNILAVIGGIAEQVLDELPPDAPRRADLVEVRAAVERGAGLTTKLLTFGRRRPAEPRPLDLASLVRDVASMLGRLLGERIELALDLPEAIAPVRADPAGIEQVLINLSLNARDAMPEGGRLTLALAERRIEADKSGPQRDTALGEFVELTVADTGAGIPAAVREHIFEPFVTTKELGRGTGLGLAVVHGVVAQAHGSIRVESEPGRGTVFRILLPRADEPAPKRAPRPEPAPIPAAESATVLVAEDDRAVRSLVERMLRAGGYRVLAAAGGEEALRLLAQEPGPVALLVTDVGMPGMSGHRLAARVREERPGTPVLLISGHLAEADPEAASRGESFLAKPFDARTLLAAARAAIDRAGPGPT